MKIRLDKYLTDMGLGTRSQIKKEIKKGNISVNGETVKQPEIKVDADTDAVLYQGRLIAYSEYEYYMLNKPSGVVSATSDSREKTVLDLIAGTKRKDLFPVGRLDKDTEGLLIITNDGESAHRLLSPKHHVDKEYYARIRGIVTEEDVRLFSEGLDIGDEKPTLPAELVILRSSDESEIRVTVREGRFHQIKRMFHAVGKEVVYLKRIRMSGLCLDEGLRTGEYRRLTKEEVDKLLC